VPHSPHHLAPPDPRSAAIEQEFDGFSYIVSHDLATSFRHVAEFSRLLVSTFGDDLTDTQRAYAARVRTSTDKCQLMMEQLLVFSRAQHRVMAAVQYDATPTMKLVRLRLATELQSAHAEVSIAPLGEVYGDPILLEIIFHALLDNAIKFRRPGVSPMVRIETAHDDAFWRLQLIDNGPGIDPPYREKAFVMFHRLNGEDAYSGSGAGLAIARRIARRHGGDLTFLDCADGACIELALPRPETLH